MTVGVRLPPDVRYAGKVMELPPFSVDRFQCSLQ